MRDVLYKVGSRIYHHGDNMWEGKHPQKTCKKTCVEGPGGGGGGQEKGQKNVGCLWTSLCLSAAIVLCNKT